MYSFIKKFWGIGIMAILALTFSGCSSDDNDDSSSGGEEIAVDTELPSVYIMSPTSEESYVTNESNIMLSGTAQDDRELKEVNYVSDRGAKGVATGLEQWSINNLPLEEGDNVITVKAVDKSDNSSTTSITITKNRYLIFFGIPVVDNTMLYSNVSTESWITVSIAPNEHLLAESVRVIEVNSSGKEIGEICNLFDDGDLSEHGDEIKGDNIFSAKHIFNLSGEGTHHYRVSAKTSESEGEVEGFSSVFTITVVDQGSAESKIQALMKTQQGIEKAYKDISKLQLSIDEKESRMREYLDTQQTIMKVERVGTELEITHTSGLISYVELETNSDIQGSGNEVTNTKPRSGKAIPLSQQTRGINSLGYNRASSLFAASSKEETKNYIPSKQVFIWAPCEDEFSVNMEPTLHDIIEKCPAKLEVTYLKNEECTIQSLENLNPYGIIIFDTHGKGGYKMLTRSQVLFENHEKLWGLVEWTTNNHEELGLLTGEYSITTRANGSFYVVTSKFFISHIKGKLSNCIVYNSSCESMKTDRLANAFILKGARTYLGYKESTTVTNCKQKAKEFFTSLLGSKLMTTGESYNAMTTTFDELNDDGSVRHNALLMRGSSDMHFYLGLINGDFEYGNMTAWTTSGDGRTITSLGPLRPTEGSFMGIVSTGLGYTENYGSISQSFYVNNETTLSLKWNFLSEEFMEYVGSIYQDYLKVSIIDDAGEHELLRINVDNFAANYSLEHVSPEIVFDRNDVYMTGWKTNTYDISAYKGKNVQLVIETGDVGDSKFDSATLLDEISIY